MKIRDETVFIKRKTDKKMDETKFRSKATGAEKGQ